ncbi:MAG: hypothetical protein U0411_09450 [Thermodesulfovibrionales bacterium]
MRKKTLRGGIVIVALTASFLIAASLHKANAAPQEGIAQVRSLEEARALAFLQRVYFSLEQALFYAEKSRNAKVLPSFDFERFAADIDLIRKDLGVYLYPRSEKLTGEAVPFRIDGDYFLNDIINAK